MPGDGDEAPRDGLGKIPDELRADGRARTQEFVDKLERAMAVIAEELKEHGGIYPHNKGRLGKAELYRRASVSATAIYGALHRDTTKKIVDAWEKKIKGENCVEVAKVRRAVGDGAKYWKGEHEKIVASYRIAELELIEARRAIRDLESELDAARKGQGASRQGSVIPFPGKPEK